MTLPSKPPPPLIKKQTETVIETPSGHLAIDIRSGQIAIIGTVFLSDLDHDTAKLLMKEVARFADLHPDAVADFLDDVTQVEPE